MNNTKEQKNYSSMPWDIEPLDRFSKTKAEFARLILILFLPLAIVGGIWLAVTLIRDRHLLSFWQTIGLSSFLFLIILLCFIIYKFDDMLHKKLFVMSLEKNPGETIQILHRGIGRNLYGDQNPEFTDDGMHITGLLTPNNLLEFVSFIAVFALLLILTVLAWFILRLPAVLKIWSGAAGFLLIGFMIRHLFFLKDEKISIHVKPDDIHSVKCEGSIINIIFTKPPKSRLKAIRLFIPPHLRRSFFKKFNEKFPELLPYDYRQD